MKSLFLIALFLFCEKIFPQTWEVIKSDTVNKTDSRGIRRGRWLLLGRHKPKTRHAPNQVVETGMYENNMKEGIWKVYNCNNTLKNEMYYVHGKVNGKAILYRKNGKLFAQGTFKIDHWINELELFDESGRLLYRINFDENGYRKQSTYFHYTKTKSDSAIIWSAK